MSAQRGRVPAGTAFHPDRPAVNGDAASRRQVTLSRLPRQRRPAMLAAAVALIGVGVLGSAALYQRLDQRVSVLVATASVPAGSVITASDVGTSSVAAGPGVRLIPARQQRQVVGLIAATALRPGMLIAPSEVTTTMPPAAGQVLVTVAMHLSGLPASGLAPGDQVDVVATRGIPGEPGTTASGSAALPAPVPATVEAVSSAPNQDGLEAVDLLVAASQGPAVASQASTGQIALVVTGRAPR
jgi:hypothetical protein